MKTLLVSALVLATTLATGLAIANPVRHIPAPRTATAGSNSAKVCPAIGGLAHGAALARQAGAPPSEVLALVLQQPGMEIPVLRNMARSIILEVYAHKWTPTEARQMSETQCFLTVR